MESFKERLIEEHSQLMDRVSKLGKFIKSETFAQLDNKIQPWMLVQEMAMRSYLYALERRMQILGYLPLLTSGDLYANNQDSRCADVPPKSERPLQRPAAYHLIDCLKELKYGRPVLNQDFLDECIFKLQDDPIKGEPFK